MRTTVEIADSLMEEVRAVMKRRGATLRALVEDGLRHVMEEEEEEERGPVELPDARFPGQPGFVDGVHAQELPRLIADGLHRGRDPELDPGP